MPASNEQGFSTKAIHAGQDPLQWSHASVVPPLVMSTTFKQSGPAQHSGYEYGRSGNPSRNCLETCLAALDNGKHAVVFSSGLGALTGLLAMLETGDHVVCGDDVYGGTNRFFKRCASKQGIETSFVDACNVDHFLGAVKPSTKMIWIETPTNPLLKLADIKGICDKVKATRPDIITVVDNTFVTCYFQKPLDLGADISMYSLTKYMNGHSDVIMGAAITSRDDYAERLRFIQNGEFFCLRTLNALISCAPFIYFRNYFLFAAMGIVPSPFDCALVNRSLKTLELRMQQHMKNGLAVANFLSQHPYVEKCIHPLFESHPQHELAKRQMSGYSGIISFYIKGNSDVFLKSLQLFILAESLGGYESLAELPSVMTHASVPLEEREKLGITDNLIRLSVGIENEADIIGDLNRALNSAMTVKSKQNNVVPE
ncbi:unnamed protein product [Trichogramma brassicae]|uniref:cystathionine gamma-lyase n=1 Tax=Trichogramma brassicae TaxID=86971 RepID=A0A6H5HVF9_9HYME|nr:unnamed protein product [Trichogramma brassicae]